MYPQLYKRRFSTEKAYLKLVVFAICVVNCISSNAQKFKDPYNDSVFLSGNYFSQLDFKRIDKLLNQPKLLTDKQHYYLLYAKGLKFYVDGKFEQSILTYERALPLKNRFKVKPYVHGIFLFYMATSYSTQSNLKEKTLNALISADSIFLLTKKPFPLGKSRDFIVQLFLQEGKIDLALTWINEAEVFFNQLNTPFPDQLILSKAGIYNQLGDRKRNKEYYIKSLELCNELIKRNDLIQRFDIKTRVLSEKGIALSNLGKSEEAIQLYKEAQEINLHNGMIEGAISQSFNLFHEYMKLKKYKEGIEIGNYIIQKRKEQKSTNRLNEIHLKLADAYADMGDYKKSNQHLFLYNKYNEEFLKEKYSSSLTELSTQYKTKEKDQKIKTLRKEKTHEAKLKKAKERQLILSVIGLGIVFILLIIAIVTTIKFNKARIRINVQAEQLNKQNMQLDSEIKQKNFLFRELHHRVKNNFQLIISFLRLQQNATGNKDSEQFIQNVEMKMNAMSMVHEMLYREGSTEVIPLNDYLLELGESVISVIGDAKCDAEISISGSLILMDIERAIPLGLVINELVTNSIKYADVEELSIEVNLQDADTFFILSFEDNGRGFPVDFSPNKSKSLGTRAVYLLMQQINANINWKNNPGALWQFTIPK